ncbi:MAG: MgtC/SapB family protein [Limnochordia bacterium]
MVSTMDIALRLLLATVLGGLVGLERELHGRPAGFRTNTLVCLGSTLVMLVSAYAFANTPGWSYDPGRMAAQVVSGIGFLGAGSIMREGPSIKGLTTAASLWVVAGIGLAVGSGFLFAAVFATVLPFLP